MEKQRVNADYKFIVETKIIKFGYCKVRMGRPGGGGEERWEK